MARMNMFLGLVCVVVFVVAAVGAMFLVRHLAPNHMLVSHIDSAAAVLGFMGTAFALLLAFVIFLALETYNGAQDASLEEADSILEQYEIATLFPAGQRDLVRSQLICYARGVINDEWKLMRKGQHSLIVDKWVHNLEMTVDGIEPANMRQQTGVDKFYDESLERAKGRRGRLNEADGVVPDPLWDMLLAGTLLFLGYMLLLANIEPRAFVQYAQIALVTGFIGISLLLIDYLDHPFRDGPGTIPPSSMQSVQREMQRQVPSTLVIPCDNNGVSS